MEFVTAALGAHGVFFSILALALMITVHELGHYVAARAAGIRIFEFSLGFGPTLFKKVDRKGVTWSIRAFPLGGFVHMLRREYTFGKDDNRKIVDGPYILFTWIRSRVTYKDGEQEGEEIEEERSRHLYHPTNVDPEGSPIRSIALEDVSSAWQVVVLMAGIGMNIVFAAICFSLSFMTGFDVLVRDYQFDVFDDGTTVVSISEAKVLETSTDHQVVAKTFDTAAVDDDLGIQVGDVIVAVDGVAMTTTEEVEEALNPWYRGQSFDITFARGDDQATVVYLPEYVDEDRPAEEDGGECDPNDEVPWAYYDHGLTFGTQGRLHLPIFGATLLGCVESIAVTWLTVDLTIDAVQKIAAKPQEAAQNGAAGPVGTVVAMNDVASKGISVFLQIAGFISIGIAATNLLPLPVFDGGQIILAIGHALFGRFRFYQYVDLALRVLAGMLMIVWMIFITYYDISSLF